MSKHCENSISAEAVCHCSSTHTTVHGAYYASGATVISAVMVHKATAAAVYCITH
jgi:hypothetical protein